MSDNKKIEITKLTDEEETEVAAGNEKEHISIMPGYLRIKNSADEKIASGLADCSPDNYWDCGHTVYSDGGYEDCYPDTG